MTASDPLLIDLWTPLAHKELMGGAGQRRLRLPSWVPPEDERRLAAYTIRAAYLSNAARGLLPADTDPSVRDGYREYGDPDLLVRRVVSAVLGDAWSIDADGADDDLTAGPTIPERPEEPDDPDDPISGRVYQARLAMWEQAADEAITEWEQAAETQGVARVRQGQARQWAETHQLASRLTSSERNAVGLGDGILVLWPQASGWPLVTSHDPAAFFPDQDPLDVGTGFPRRVHLAWGYEDFVGGVKTRLVRRLTWEMRPVASLRLVDGPDGPEWAPLPADEQHTGTGQVTRTLPWGDQATETCVFFDGIWQLADLLGRNEHHPDTDPFAVAPLQWLNPGTDLRLDVIPVLHTPNTAEGEVMWGRSVLDTVAQAFDDVAQADGLAMSAASYVGDPTIALTGADPGDKAIMPGRIFGIGDNGRMDVLDLSAGIEKLMGFTDSLQDRAWQNAGVPREMIGRGDVDAMSGVALALRLAPFAQLIASMRISREPKDRLLPRWAVKMAMIAGAVDPGPIGELRITRGSFLPTDRAQTIEMVARALEAHAISLATAVALLIASGVPVADAQAEVARIKAEWPSAAKDVADATGSERLAADWLNVDIPDIPAGAVPIITLPPAGGTE